MYPRPPVVPSEKVFRVGLEGPNTEEVLGGVAVFFVGSETLYYRRLLPGTRESDMKRYHVLV